MVYQLALEPWYMITLQLNIRNIRNELFRTHVTKHPIQNNNMKMRIKQKKTTPFTIYY